jgi:ketosteroid isomerase-like protein
MPTTSTPTENASVAAELFRRLDASDVSGAMELLADDAAWWIAGTPGCVPGAGEHTKPQMAKLLHAMLAQLRDGMRITVRGTTAQDDRVSVETEAAGTLLNGREYRQRQHFLVRVADGRIREVREYLDTDHTREVWSQP